MRAFAVGSLFALTVLFASAAKNGEAAPSAPKPAAPKPAPAKPAASSAKPAAAKGPVTSGAAKPKVLSAGWAPPGYVAMVKKWHEPSPAAPKTEGGRPKLVLRAINGTERVELEPLTDHGGFSPIDLDRASHI